MEAHFLSVQRICDKTALPAVMPSLRCALQSHLDLDAQLRVLRSAATVSSHQKLEAWTDLKILGFTRAATATLSLAVLSLHMKIMLNILSRQLYLEHALHSTPGRTGWTSLSVGAQETFLALVEKGFASNGIEHLTRVVKVTVSRKVAELQLSRSLTAMELRAVLRAIRDELLPIVVEGRWGTGIGAHSAPGSDGLHAPNPESSENTGACGEQSALESSETSTTSWVDLLLPHGDISIEALSSEAGAATGAADDECASAARARADSETEQLLSMVQEAGAYTRPLFSST